MFYFIIARLGQSFTFTKYLFTNYVFLTSELKNLRLKFKFEMRILLLSVLLGLLLITEYGRATKQSGNQFSCHCNCSKNSKVLISLMRTLLSRCGQKTVTGNCPKAPPKNCQEVLKCGGKKSGVYKVDPDGKGEFKVYCDQTTAGGGWTVFQRRQDGSVDFYRGWNDYKNGFGDLKGEFWLGLDNIHRLTHQTRNRLRVEVGDAKGKSAYAEYDYFAVNSERFKYKLSLGTYSGTAGDSLSYHRNMAFTTKDSDNDKSSPNCAADYKAAWWYNNCYHSSLNGQYKYRGTSSTNGVVWQKWKSDYSLARAEMKIRPQKK